MDGGTIEDVQADVDVEIEWNQFGDWKFLKVFLAGGDVFEEEPRADGIE
jgi:hypothetical protein